MPEALSLAPRPSPLLSRCASDDDRVGRAADDDGGEVAQLDRPQGPARPPSRRSLACRKPYSAQLVARTMSPRRAPRPSRACGRDGCAASSLRQLGRRPRRRRAAATRAAAAPRAAPTVNAASRSGSATSSNVPRTLRALIGRSSEPRRGRPRARRGARRRHPQAIVGAGRRPSLRPEPCQMPDPPRSSSSTTRTPSRSCSTTRSSATASASSGTGRRGGARAVRGGGRRPRRARHHAAAGSTGSRSASACAPRAPCRSSC